MDKMSICVKWLKSLIIFICVVGSLTTCKKPIKEIPASLSINPDKKYEIPSNDGNFIISTSSTTTWTVNSDKNWLRLNPISGNYNTNSVNVAYDANSETSDRTAIIKFIPVGTSEQSIAVTQKGKILYKPAVLSQNATTIQQTSAVLNGSVNANGLSTTVVFECGTTTNYGQIISANQGTLIGNSEVVVSANATNLLSGVTYHFRLKATNSIGTTEGNDLSFMTLTQGIPSVSSSVMNNITQTTATSGGNVSADGGAVVSSRGVCWATSHFPTISNSKTIDGSGLGVFSSILSGLNAGSTCYARAYATNIIGTAYGNEIQFSTLPENSLATISTNAVSAIAPPSAVSGGNISSDGGSTITSRGVCWSITQNPTISNSKTSDGNGVGNFTSNLTGLITGTNYYVRAYATNGVGTAYGNQQFFSTSLIPSLATLTTTSASTITSTDAVLGGSVTSDGNATVTERGVVYATTQNPTTSNSKVVMGSGTGNFTLNVTGFIAATTYYVRAYAINSQGTAYGNGISFTTSSSGNVTVSDNSGNVYHMVTIGNQIWMVENLKTTKYNDNSSIYNITAHEAFNNSTEGAYCWYENNEVVFKNDGALYNWYAVNTKKLCPIGWRVPSNSDWLALTTFLGSNAGDKMKASKGWSPSNYAFPTNSSGFSAIPTGSRGFSQWNSLSTDYAWWWSSTNSTTTFSYTYYLYYNNSYLSQQDNANGKGYNVRCMKDK